MENLFKKQSAKFNLNRLSFTEVMVKTFLVCFFLCPTVYYYYYKCTDYSDASQSCRGTLHIRFEKRWLAISQYVRYVAVIKHLACIILVTWQCKMLHSTSHSSKRTFLIIYCLYRAKAVCKSVCTALLHFLYRAIDNVIMWTSPGVSMHPGYCQPM